MRPITLIVVHCSATSPNPKIDARTIDGMHRKRGMSKIGYHYVIKTNGEVQTGRSEDEVGAHALGYNRESLGICLIGGVGADLKPTNNFTKQQMDALLLLLQNLKIKYGSAEILGHRDLSPDLNGDGVITKNEYMKECPCFDVRSWLKTF